MTEHNLEEVIKSSSVIIHKGRYAYLKTKEKDLNNHFLVSQDKDEITVITEEKNLTSVTYEDEVRWFKLIEIKVAIPFLKGFIAKVTNLLAPYNVNTLIVSTFSKDYILTKEEDIDNAIKGLEASGFKVEIEQ